MSTNALIGKMNEDGTVSAIYLHWDGYYNHAGVTLEEFYATEEAVSALIEQGSCSELGKDIGAKHDFNERIEGWCKFYHRDRGERKNIQSFHSRASFVRNGRGSYEWFYLYENGGWVIFRA